MQAPIILQHDRHIFWIAGCVQIIFFLQQYHKKIPLQTVPDSGPAGVLRSVERGQGETEAGVQRWGKAGGCEGMEAVAAGKPGSQHPHSSSFFSYI